MMAKWIVARGPNTKDGHACRGCSDFCRGGDESNKDYGDYQQRKEDGIQMWYGLTMLVRANEHMMR